MLATASLNLQRADDKRFSGERRSRRAARTSSARVESGKDRTPPDHDTLDVRVVLDGLVHPLRLHWLEGDD
jgi:hypothetical protein